VSKGSVTDFKTTRAGRVPRTARRTRFHARRQHCCARDRAGGRHADPPRAAGLAVRRGCVHPPVRTCRYDRDREGCIRRRAGDARNHCGGRQGEAVDPTCEVARTHIDATKPQPRLVYKLAALGNVELTLRFRKSSLERGHRHRAVVVARAADGQSGRLVIPFRRKLARLSPDRNAERPIALRLRLCEGRCSAAADRGRGKHEVVRISGCGAALRVYRAAV
jgi:hypothetical protein